MSAMQFPQVRGLLQLFHDVEHTDRSNTFYEKFNTRYKAGEILREFANQISSAQGSGSKANSAADARYQQTRQ